MKKIVTIVVMLGCCISLLGCQKEDTTFQMKDSMRVKDTEESTQKVKFDFVNNQESDNTSTQEQKEEQTTEQQKTEQQTTQQQKTEQQTREQETKKEKQENKGNDSGSDKESEGKKKTTDKAGDNADENGKKSNKGESVPGEDGNEDTVTDVEAPDVMIEVSDEDEIVE